MEVNSSARSSVHNQKLDIENSHIGHKKRSHLVNKPLKADQLMNREMINI